jgi:hypothetical protein
MKERIKRFYNNVNSKTLKSIEEIATAIAIVHNLVRIGKRGGNTNLSVPCHEVLSCWYYLLSL